MTLHTYPDLAQGSEEWLTTRRGIVTASVVGQLITARPLSGIAFQCPECGAEPDAPCYSMARKGEPTPIKTLHTGRVTVAAESDAPPVLEPARTDTSRALTRTLVAERITGWTEDPFVSTAMMRGTMDEPIARNAYARHCTTELVTELGFMVRDDWGFRIGYSPDGLVGDDGLIEIKSREPKAQLATILADEIPAANVAQIQCGLLVSGREWCDYVSFAGGMPLWTQRIYPDPRWHDAIVAAVAEFEDQAAVMVAAYEHNITGLPMTERVNHDLAGIEF